MLEKVSLFSMPLLPFWNYFVTQLDAVRKNEEMKVNA